MIMKSNLIAATMLLAMLSACGSGTQRRDSDSDSSQQARFETYCSQKNLSATLRQSFVVIDAKIIAKSNSPEEFLERNIDLRNMILSIADPEKAIASGMAAPRERFTIFVAPNDGSAARPIFTGCVPGLSASERQSLLSGSDKTKEFFTGDPLNQIVEDGNVFRELLVKSLSVAATDGSDVVGGHVGALESAPFFQSLLASKSLIEGANDQAKRVFLITDMSRTKMTSRGNQETPRAQGFAAATPFGDLLRLADVYLVQPAKLPLSGQDFLGSFVSGQGGRLISFGSGVPSIALDAPVKRWRFSGKIEYPSGPEQVEIVLGRNDKGKLVSSWFVLLGSNASATPMTGTISCSSDDSCQIKSDSGGFAQIWKTAAGVEPEWSDKMPLAGSRSFSFDIEGSELSGFVSDENVQLSENPEKPGLAVTAIRSEGR